MSAVRSSRTRLKRGKSTSPGLHILRRSRMFSLPDRLPDPPSTNFAIGDFKSSSMTRHYPQYQSITSPLSSREKGDWGLKRPFPLKTTLTTSTPLIRVKQIDSTENVTDFASAADHTLSLEKFQELRVALSVRRPKRMDMRSMHPSVKGESSPGNFFRQPQNSASDLFVRSVFERDLDFTHVQAGLSNNKRWRFEGPWLARMTAGEFTRYLEEKVRPRRAQFQAMLRDNFAMYKTAQQKLEAQERGKKVSRTFSASHISDDEFTIFLRKLRGDLPSLYALISKFLDLPPLGQPLGITSALGLSRGGKAASQSPYGEHGPPPCHPSAGISYLRTSSIMQNHPVYGPQAKPTPVLARVVYPRVSLTAAKLGVGGFIANVPSGLNAFNLKHGTETRESSKILKGILHLDTSTPGGAKAYVEPFTARVDPSGKIVLQLMETGAEAELIARESRGRASIYIDKAMQQPSGSRPLET